MNKISKLLISYILMFSICFVMLSTMHVRADGETGGDNNDITMLAAPRTLSVEFMGKNIVPTEAGVAAGTFSTVEQDPYDNVFWISVAVTGVEDLSIFNNGIYSFEVAFDYDPSFVEPYSDPNALDKEQDWNDNIKSGNLWTTQDNHGLATYSQSTWWDGTIYEVYSSRESDIDTSIRRDDRTLAATRKSNGWKMCSAQIRVASTTFSASTARFYGLTSTDKQYLIKLPFRLLKVPASTDADQNPIVISLVRGTEKLSIGSGSDGVSPHSEWYPTDFVNAPTTGEENMEPLFNFAGDIKLFASTAVSAISDIVPTQPANPPDIPADVTYTISRDKTEQKEGFAATTNKYYISVPNDVDSIRLDINASSQPTAYLNTSSNTLTVTPTGTAYQTDVFNLDELDKTKEADGYNNKVVVTAGSSSYEVYIRRLLKPKIELNYGNSPYGEIMKAANIAATDKQAAKDAFNLGNIYKAPYIPDNVQIKIKSPTGTPLGLSTNISSYPYRAWVDTPSLQNMTQQQKDDLEDPDINMDRNDYTIFIYNTKPFVDPGFTAVDSEGNLVTNVDRKITVNRMNYMDVSGIYDNNYTSRDIVIQNQPSNYLITEITCPYNQNDSSTFLIRPDKYEMTYTFTDPKTNEIAEIKRYVVVLQSKGDTDFSLNINLQDVNTVYQFYNRAPTYFKTTGSDHVITGTARTIYAYRCLDLDGSDSVNLQDVNPVYQSYNKYRQLSTANKALNNNPVEEWYVELPSS